MQEDKQLKEWLMKHAVEQPAPDFTSRVMEQVTSAYNYQQQPFFKQPLPRVLLGVFILVCIAVFILALKIPAAAITFRLTAMLPAKAISQCISFLIAFWVVAMLNIVYQKVFADRAYHGRYKT